MSAKNWQVTPTWHKCHFTSPPPHPPPPENAKLAILDRSWLQDFRFLKCQFNPSTPLYPHPTSKIQICYIWTDLYFRFSDFRFSKCHFNPPPPPQKKWKAGIVPHYTSRRPKTTSLVVSLSKWPSLKNLVNQSYSCYIRIPESIQNISIVK